MTRYINFVFIELSKYNCVLCLNLSILKKMFLGCFKTLQHSFPRIITHFNRQHWFSNFFYLVNCFIVYVSTLNRIFSNLKKRVQAWNLRLHICQNVSGSKCFSYGTRRITRRQWNIIPRHLWNIVVELFYFVK